MRVFLRGLFFVVALSGLALAAGELVVAHKFASEAGTNLPAVFLAWDELKPNAKYDGRFVLAGKHLGSFWQWFAYFAGGVALSIVARRHEREQKEVAQFLEAAGLLGDEEKAIPTRQT